MGRLCKEGGESVKSCLRKHDALGYPKSSCLRVGREQRVVQTRRRGEEETRKTGKERSRSVMVCNIRIEIIISY